MKIVVLRGNAGSGKSTVARGVRARLGVPSAMIEKDVVRREILGGYTGEVTSSKVKEVMRAIVRAANELGREYMIIEGIMKVDKWGDFFRELADNEQNEVFFYYFDLSWEETVRRHGMRKKSEEFGSDEMRQWFLAGDYLRELPESRIEEAMGEKEVVEMILRDIGARGEI